jgi:hypothetical protein
MKIFWKTRPLPENKVSQNQPTLRPETIERQIAFESADAAKLPFPAGIFPSRNG